MSDPEDDRDFLDEIKALEDVLAGEESSARIKEDKDDKKDVVKREFGERDSAAPRRGNPESRGFGEVEPSREESPSDDFPSERGSGGRSLLETNRELADLLRETRRELLAILERCTENRSAVEEKIRTRVRDAKSSRVLVCTAGMPYFKDAQHYPAPRNKDVAAKTGNGELRAVHLRRTYPWTTRDRNILWRAIRQEAAGQLQQDGREETPESPKSFRRAIGAAGGREFDWLKIAAMDLDERHTAEECRVMWRVFLHPDIRRSEWSSEEDEAIGELAEKFGRQDWDGIAEELNERRSGYQCFIRYNSLNRATRSDESPWSAEEDRRLGLCVAKFKIGHYVPWGVVSRYVPMRSKPQVYYRWMYNAAPNLKKGRFTEEEDRLLMQAVRKYGPNFCKISSCLIGNRSSAQLSDHYHTLLARNRGLPNSWSINEDSRLLVLYNEHGPDWSSIARNLPGKTRTQVRHRHKAITRYWDKGVSLYEIPRDYRKNIPSALPYDPGKSGDGDEEDGDDEDEDMDGETEASAKSRRNDAVKSRRDESTSIDAELVGYFRLVPGTSRPGRRAKYYGDEELEETTRKLSRILKVLDADLVIPDKLEETCLTEKEKQLAETLKDWQRWSSKKTTSPSASVCYASASDRNGVSASPEAEKHFSPLCRGDCNGRKKLLRHDSIDCQPPPSLDHCRMRLEMRFETPETIVAVLGEETNEEFGRLLKMLHCRAWRHDRTVSGLRIIENLYGSVNSQVGSKTSDPSMETTERCPSDGERKRSSKKHGLEWNSGGSGQGIIKRLDEAIACIEPNYHTLLGFRQITSRNRTTRPERISSSTAMSQEAERSMGLLKRRLIQLFKYPIGLSHMLRPEVYVGGNTPSIVDHSTETNLVVDGSAVESSETSSPPSKMVRR